MTDFGEVRPNAEDVSSNPAAQKKGVSEFRNEFRTSRFFAHPPRDFSPNIFRPEVIRWTGKDIQDGIESPYEKLSIVVAQAMGSLWTALKRPENEIKDNQIQDKVEALSRREPVFISIPHDQLHEDLVDAAQKFGADQSGMIMKVFFHRSFNTANTLLFPAVLKDDKRYRLLQITTKEDARTLQHAFDTLSLPTVVQKDGDKTTAFMEFVDGIEHPKDITQEELDDWLQRVQKSGVEFGVDIGKEDESLDNLIRYKGKLYWCDGNLMGAKSIDEQKAAEVASHHRSVLQRFIRS